MWGRHAHRPDKWTWRDIALAEALRIYEDNLCGRCGHPSTQTYDPRNAGEFVRKDDITCLACYELEAKADDKLDPGQKAYVANLMGT